MAQQHTTFRANVVVALIAGSIPFVAACVARAGTVDPSAGEATLLADVGVAASMPAWVVLASLLYQLLSPTPTPSRRRT